MSRQTISVTLTNTDPVNDLVVMPQNWSITAAEGYDETTPIYIGPTLKPTFVNSPDWYDSVAVLSNLLKPTHR